MKNNIMLMLVGTLTYATPLLFAALGGVISEVSGVMNIGLEGVMTIGAFTGATVSYFSESAWLGFLSAGLAGVFLIALHAIASITCRADQTISGVAVNFLGAGISILLTRKFFNGSSQSLAASKLPFLIPVYILKKFKDSKLEILRNISVATVIAFTLVAIIWFVLYKTKWGLRILATGEHPAAVDTLGISVFKLRYSCVLISGFLAGIGGAFLSISVASEFSQVTICGQGFIALAAVIFGKWTPHGAMLGCLLFGFARECTTLFGGSETFISPILINMFPYVLTILILIFFIGKSAAPKANGKPYIADSR